MTYNQRRVHEYSLQQLEQEITRATGTEYYSLEIQTFEAGIIKTRLDISWYASQDGETYQEFFVSAQGAGIADALAACLNDISCYYSYHVKESRS